MTNLVEHEVISETHDSHAFMPGLETPFCKHCGVPANRPAAQEGCLRNPLGTWEKGGE